MARAKPQPVEEVEEEVPQYTLEQLSDNAMEQLKIWGNTTQLTITKLQSEAPGWSKLLEDIFVVVRESVKENSQ